MTLSCCLSNPLTKCPFEPKLNLKIACFKGAVSEFGKSPSLIELLIKRLVLLFS